MQFRIWDVAVNLCGCFSYTDTFVMVAHSLSLGLYDFYTTLRLLQPRSPEAGTGPISAATRGGLV